MKNPVRSVSLCLAMTAVLLFATTAATAQAPAANAKGAASAPLPRAADGHPKIAGVWQAGGVSLLGEAGAPPKFAPQPITVQMPRREPLAYQPWALEKQKTFSEKDDPSLYCLLPGVPRITSQPFPLEIVQTPEKIVILYEAFRVFRNIPIDSKLKHPDDMTPTWMGDSVARWEGDTLVVDVKGFNDKTWIAGTGTLHTEDMHVVERYTLNPDGTLSYIATVEDPKALTKPWTTGAVMRKPVNVRIEEYECNENNQDIPHMKER